MRCFSACLLALLVVVSADPGPIAQLNGRQIQGRWTPATAEFLGIPFASHTRFERSSVLPPAAIPGSPSTPFQATQFGPCCPQVEAVYAPNQQEKCLNLNVFVGNLDFNTTRSPVLVWIHGGGGTTGCSAQASPALYNGSHLVATARDGGQHLDVVVVTINYRLGVLGHLYLDGMDDALQSHDWLTALEWVQDNIEAFGGDPTRVMVFGQSAGGNAVLTLPLMPGAKGLFHRGIAESSTAFLATGYVDPATADQDGRQVAAGLNCSQASTDAILGCLRALSAETIQHSIGLTQLGIPVGPGRTFSMYPQHLFEANLSVPVDVIAGQNTPDNWPLCAEVPTANASTATAFLQAQVAAWTSGTVEEVNHALDVYGVKDCVPSNPGPGQETCCALATKMMGDLSFSCPTFRVLEAMGSVAPRRQFLYTLDCTPTCPPPAPGFSGVCQHTSEIAYVFGTTSDYTADYQGKPLGCHWTPNDVSFSRALIDIWTAFAATGEVPPAWTPVEDSVLYQMDEGEPFTAGTWDPEAAFCPMWRAIDEAAAVRRNITG